MRRIYRSVVIGLAISAAACQAKAAVIYRQNFSATAGMTALSAVNWNPYYGNATTAATVAAPGSTGSPPNAMISGGPSAPTAGSDVNASSIATVTSDVDGFVPLLSTNGTQQMVVYTNEYTINTSAYTPTTFSWYAASAYSGDQQTLMIQIAGNWYASTSPISPPSGVIQGSSFAAAGEQFSTTFSTAASAWDTLNFSPGSDLTLGSTLTSPLPTGNITGFGVYAQIADNASATNDRTYVDNFEVDATPLPEPASAGLIAVVAAPMLLRRRRRQ